MQFIEGMFLMRFNQEKIEQIHSKCQLEYNVYFFGLDRQNFQSFIGGILT